MLKIIAMLFTTIALGLISLQAAAIAPGAGQAQMQNNMQQMQQNKQRIQQMQQNKQQQQQQYQKRKLQHQQMMMDQQPR